MLNVPNVILIRNVFVSLWPGQTERMREGTFAKENIANKAREIPKTMSFEIVSPFYHIFEKLS